MITMETPASVSRPPTRMQPSGPHRRRRRGGRAGFLPYLLVAPGVVIFVIFALVPLGQTIYLSLWNWDGLSTGTFVGLANYQAALSNPDTALALGHSLLFIVTFCVIPVILGIVLAAVLSRNGVRGLGFFRTVLFLPQVISSVVIGVAWRWMYQDTGTVNQVLGLVGIHSNIAWLGDFTWALPAVGLIGSWVMTGLCMVLFLSGVGRIDSDLYDAAKVDGAGAIREFFTVTLPGLRPELTIALTITIIAALRTFDIVFVTTQGGPGKSTIVPGTEIYRAGFRDGQIGYASTLAVLLSLIVFAVVVVVNRFMTSKDGENS